MHAVHVERPAKAVFDFLADVSNETKWRQSIVGSRYVDADLPAIGVDGETDVSMGSRSLTMKWTVTELIDGEYVAWRLDGNPWNGGGSYRVLPDEKGAAVQGCLEVRLKGLARLLEPIVGLQFRRGLRSDLDRLVCVLPEAAAE
ncbi:SRPBCC family protein [Microbacterium sp. NPDC055357]